MDELIDLYALKVFESVARNKSFSKAAEELFLSQPAVSQQIKSLEKQLGTKLFYRTSKEISLTETGEILYIHAQSILMSASKLKELVAQSHQFAPLKLTIGLSPSVSLKYISKILLHISNNYKNIDSKIVIRPTNEIQKMVAELNLNFGIILGNLNYSLLAKDKIYTDEVILLSSKNHVLTANKEISLKDLKNEVLLLQEKGSGTRALMDKYLARHRLLSNLNFEIPDINALLKAVDDNVGITFFPRLIFQCSSYHNNLLSYKLKDVNTSIDVNLIYHRDKVFRSEEIDLINHIFTF
ncbi:MAG: LysR family transcriptional regulator [Thermoanaerobacter sp.]|nr:LysR family transcriptional regulator [Thermoanaerobacter sp.]